VRSRRGSRLWLTMLVAVPLMSLPASLLAQSNKPNILVIFGDDIGQANLSRYTHGVVGYMTPNIDRVREESMTFNDYYTENSCTAGRSSFITGQSPIPTGLTKVGAPGAPVGLQKQVSKDVRRHRLISSDYIKTMYCQSSSQNSARYRIVFRAFRES
jgi:hypothetical protein